MAKQDPIPHQPPENRTKIVATMGPASANPEVLKGMLYHGLDVCRLNLSHGSHSDHQRTIDLIRQVNREEGTHLAILMDLQGPKIRIGELEAPFAIKPGDEVELCTSIDRRQGNRLPMVLETFAQDVRAGDRVLVNDGKVELRVLETNGQDSVRLVVIHGDEIGSRKGVNLPNVPLSIPAITDKDKLDLELAIQNQVDWIALSFVRTADEVVHLKRLLLERDCDARVIAKIEKPEALVNIEAIVEAADAIMVARGDLGVEIPIEEVPLWQKRIVRLCNRRAKPVIVATQMLESMVEHSSPTRAEATDVANAVLDGADAVMLSGETSVGRFPVEVVRTMQRIAATAEADETLYNRFHEVDPDSPTYHADATCLAACKFAETLNAKALVGMTRSGYTAYQLAQYRPRAHVYIFSDNRALLPAMNLVWGVRAFYYDGFVGTNESIKDSIAILKDHDLVQTGDVVINTASMPLQSRGRTNMMKYTIVG